MQPYLESLPNYIDGAPPWTPTNRGHGITSRPLKHDPEISPRDFKELRTDHIPLIFKQLSHKYISCIELHANICNQSSSISHVESIPTRYFQSMSIGLHLIPIPCLFDYQPSHLFHMPRSHNHINPIYNHSLNHAFHFTGLVHYIEYIINQTIQLTSEETQRNL